MKTVVVYYSRFGSTQTIATALAQELGAEVREIKAVRDHGFMGMGFRAAFGIRMPIRPMNLGFAGVDRIVLCTPIWAGKPANPAQTFLKEAKIEGKKLAVLFSTGGGETGRAMATVKKCVAGKSVEAAFVGAITTRNKSKDALAGEARQFAQKLKG